MASAGPGGWTYEQPTEDFDTFMDTLIEQNPDVPLYTGGSEGAEHAASNLYFRNGQPDGGAGCFSTSIHYRLLLFEEGCVVLSCRGHGALHLSAARATKLN